jgi:hypothetical protein
MSNVLTNQNVSGSTIRVSDLLGVFPVGLLVS